MGGTTPQGFERDSIVTIQRRIEARLLERISPTLDVSPESELGQLIGIFVQELGVAWEELEVAYHAFDPDKAEDSLLVALAKLTGTTKRPATRSRVLCKVNLDSGTALISGTHFAHVDGRPLARFTPESDFTSPSDGEHNVWFVSEEAGPVPAPSEQLTVIATPVVGWNSITNDKDAELGRPADTNADLRARREQELQSSGNSTLGAIASAVSKVEGVVSVVCFENTTNAPDANGVPPHSIEVLVADGLTGSADDDEVAQAIWDAKAGGIRPYGLSSGSAVDRWGNERVVGFSRVAPKAVYVEIDVIVREADYIGNTALAVRLAERANALQALGQDVRIRQVDSLVYGLSGVVDVTGFRMGYSPNPSGTVNLPVGTREIAYFDSANITVASTSA